MTAADTYLAERGILETTLTACGWEIEPGPNTEKVRTRLGFGTNGHAPLAWNGEAVLWIPLTDPKGIIISWTGRFFPQF